MMAAVLKRGVTLPSWLRVAASVTEAKDGGPLEYYDVSLMLHFLNTCFGIQRPPRVFAQTETTRLARTKGLPKSCTTSHTWTLHGHETNSGKRDDNNNKARPRGPPFGGLSQHRSESRFCSSFRLARPRKNAFAESQPSACAGLCSADAGNKVQLKHVAKEAFIVSGTSRQRGSAAFPEVLRQIYWIFGLAGNQTNA